MLNQWGFFLLPAMVKTINERRTKKECYSIAFKLKRASKEMLFCCCCCKATKNTLRKTVPRTHKIGRLMFGVHKRMPVSYSPNFQTINKCWFWSDQFQEMKEKSIQSYVGPGCRIRSQHHSYQHQYHRAFLHLYISHSHSGNGNRTAISSNIFIES